MPSHCSPRAGWPASLTDPTSLSFWGRGIGGDYEFSIPDHEFDAGLDLTGLTEVQIWISYQFLR